MEEEPCELSGAALKALAHLMEHADTAVVLLSKRSDDGNTTTSSFRWSGNVFAVRGMAEAFAQELRLEASEIWRQHHEEEEE